MSSAGSAATCSSAGLLFWERLSQVSGVLSCVELSFTHGCGAERRSFSHCLVCVTNRNILGTCGVRPTLIGTWSRTWQCLQASSVISYSWYSSSCLSFVYVRGCSLRLLNHWRGFTGLQRITQLRRHRKTVAFKHLVTSSIMNILLLKICSLFRLNLLIDFIKYN